MPIASRTATFRRAAALALTIPAGLALAGGACAQSVTCEVTINTSDNISGAGTDANLFLPVYGTQSPAGVKAPTDLDGAGNVFEEGDGDTFKVTFDVPIGHLEMIKIAHENKRPRAGWHIDNVQIKDPVNNETVTFEFDRWLAKDEDDRLLEATRRRADYDAWSDRYTEQADPPVGRWERACTNSQTCASRIFESLSFGSTNTTSWSNTAKLTVGAKWKSGFEFEGLSSGTEFSVEASDAFTNAAEIAESKTSDHSESCEISNSATEARIQTVWQGVVSSQIEDQTVTVKTCRTTCTATDHRPEYLPGDPRDHDTCNTPRDFQMILNAGLPGNNREIMETVSLTDCLQACRAQPWCKTADDQRGPGRCFLQEVSQADVALKRDHAGNPFDHFYLPERTGN